MSSMVSPVHGPEMNLPTPQSSMQFPQVLSALAPEHVAKMYCPASPAEKLAGLQFALHVEHCVLSSVCRPEVQRLMA